MHCPVCDLEMTVMREDVSLSANDQKYDRRIYKCVKDDVWTTVEIPKKILVSV